MTNVIKITTFNDLDFLLLCYLSSSTILITLNYSMKIGIYWRTVPTELDDRDIGVEQDWKFKDHYHVIDKHKFMLAVLKYGIEYDELP